MFRLSCICWPYKPQTQRAAATMKAETPCNATLLRTANLYLSQLETAKPGSFEVWKLCRFLQKVCSYNEVPSTLWWSAKKVLIKVPVKFSGAFINIYMGSHNSSHAHRWAAYTLLSAPWGSLELNKLPLQWGRAQTNVLVAKVECKNLIGNCRLSLTLWLDTTWR